MRVALYLRVSREDGDREESASIQGQRNLLLQHLRKLARREHWEELHLQEYVDDGCSGTLPGGNSLGELIRAVAEERVDVILVKDLSRFSRNSGWLSDCRTHLLPTHQVRLISVADGYDGLDVAPGLTADFWGIFHDHYSRELSLKVRSSLRAMEQQGKYPFAKAPYGYRKDPDDPHRLVIHPEEAACVRAMFSMRLSGCRLREIAQALQDQGIQTPSGRPFTTQGISHVLSNQTYVGDMTCQKTASDFLGAKRRPLPRQEWRIIPDQHPPIVSREDFEGVALLRRSASRQARDPEWWEWILEAPQAPSLSRRRKERLAREALKRLTDDVPLARWKPALLAQATAKQRSLRKRRLARTQTRIRRLLSRKAQLEQAREASNPLVQSELEARLTRLRQQAQREADALRRLPLLVEAAERDPLLEQNFLKQHVRCLRLSPLSAPLTSRDAESLTTETPPPLPTAKNIVEKTEEGTFCH